MLGAPTAIALSREAVALTLACRPADARAAAASVASCIARGDGGIEGRHAIDVAFNLALAGAADSPALDMLAATAEAELRELRWRRRGWSKPRSAYTLVQLAEKAAAAGLAAPLGLFDIIGEMLSECGEYSELATDLQAGRFGLSSPRAAAWLYRTARKQPKWSMGDARAAAQPAAPCARLPRGGSPLVLDLGCGFGVGVLTAAAASRRDGDGTAFVGCDLSPLGVAFAPAADSRSSGNSQLPEGLESDGFLGQPRLLRAAAKASPPCAHREPPLAPAIAPGGTLLLSSNAEDVAVRMSQAALAAGFGLRPAAASSPHHSASRDALLSRRSRRWREAGGQRAVGGAWRIGASGWERGAGGRWGGAARAVERPAWSETELAHAVDRAALHRMLLVKPDDAMAPMAMPDAVG
ncbi:hypothetical protein EMIHUDRAFT_458920 [Emiliania huxleyi CCMP1516]|uniref:Methyltransferase domain-containing protein n=2 Tax=Emiliania huxleyi TaxID=2903 RepID=A0A0D3J4T3_EMIH1|nr:hypothetical protein EMIHUDRAFT_458920 [Emiliania huxleyi CCMP1516]EOD18518.1 hypothetical protein EMIHUDRAFT_458920 [Emiliania huxleyi CCMP1516]|eukprot:XP_005770947.1 hypothetical protein EMIHUDRAFT_458920 [Emiliania huxleyi CCMP1516]